MNTLGIEKTYKIVKKVRRKLLLNDKFINYLLKRLNKGGYVYMTSSSSYEKITPELLKVLVKKLEKDDRYLYLECFAKVDDDPEYEGIPFEVTHASPYDHRFPGDYDEDAYDDWEIAAVSLTDLLYEDNWQEEPVYVVHPEMFDFAEEEVVVEDEKLERTNYLW